MRTGKDDDATTVVVTFFSLVFCSITFSEVYSSCNGEVTCTTSESAGQWQCVCSRDILCNTDEVFATTAVGASLLCTWRFYLYILYRRIPPRGNLYLWGADSKTRHVTTEVSEKSLHG